MSLIYNDVLPWDFAESGFVIQNVFIGGKHYMELVILQVLCKQRSLILLAFVDNLPNIRSPLVKFHAPV